MIAAFVLVNCHFPFDTSIIHQISEIPSVTSVYRTEGRFDLMVKINAESEENLTRMVSRNFNTIHGVDATLTLIIT